MKIEVVARPEGVYIAPMGKGLVSLTGDGSAETAEEAPAFVATLADRSNDGRLMYYEPQLQRSRHYSGRLADLPEDRVRALYREVMRYFAGEMPLPPAGLPGHLHAKYDVDEPAGELLALGLSYHSAIVFNERRSMHNRWAEARAFIGTVEDRARHEVWTAIEAERRAEAEQRANEAASPEVEQQVYFIGSESGPIKIGIAANVDSRLKGLQTAHHEKLIVLATCSGGMVQERAYHARFAAHRLHGEWFERHPDILAEIDLLNGRAG